MMSDLKETMGFLDERHENHGLIGSSWWNLVSIDEIRLKQEAWQNMKVVGKE